MLSMQDDPTYVRGAFAAGVDRVRAQGSGRGRARPRASVRSPPDGASSNPLLEHAPCRCGRGGSWRPRSRRRCPPASATSSRSCLRLGHTNQEIAPRWLFISVRTARDAPRAHHAQAWPDDEGRDRALRARDRAAEGSARRRDRRLSRAARACGKPACEVCSSRNGAARPPRSWAHVPGAHPRARRPGRRHRGRAALGRRVRRGPPRAGVPDLRLGAHRCAGRRVLPHRRPADPRRASRSPSPTP